MNKVELLKYSVNPNGQKIATFRIKHPRFILAQLLTHRMFSRNSGSNRAKSTSRLISEVLSDKYFPRVNEAGKGMVGGNKVSSSCQEEFDVLWKNGRDGAINLAREMVKLGVAKQYVNRVLEPYMMNTLLVTATEFDNFFKLRCEEDAQPEIQEVANEMKELLVRERAVALGWGEWHIPLGVNLVDSVAKCARVSYGNELKEFDMVRDGELFNRLRKGGHYSPFEHQAMACEGDWANFRGWRQYRWSLEREGGF